MARKKLLTEGEVRQFMKLANLGPLSENYFTNNPLDEQEEEEFGAEEIGPEGGEELELGAAEDEVPLDDAGLEGDEGAEGGEAEDLVMGLLQVIQPWAEEHGVDMELDGDEEGGEEEVEDVEAVELEEPGGEEELELGAEEEEVPVPGNMDLYEGEGSKKDDTDDEEIDEGNRRPRGVGGLDDITGEKTSFATGRKQPGKARGPGKRSGYEASPEADEEDWFQDLDDEEREALKEAYFAKRDASHREEIVAEVARRVAQRLSADKQKETVAEQLAERIFERLTSK
jgi:hypothetical protein